MASFWPVSRASLKPSLSLSRTLCAVSTNQPRPTTTTSKNPNPNAYPNGTLLGPFTQRHRWSPSCVDFDLRLVAHISSSSSSTGADKDGNQGSNDVRLKLRLLGSTCICRGKLALMRNSLASTGPLALGCSLGLVCGQ